MQKQLGELKRRLLEINDLMSAAAVLEWDQSTYMPHGGAPARARQLATLSRLAHEKFTDPALGKLLDALTPHGESLPYDSDDAALIRVTRREFERRSRIPAAFTAAFQEHSANSFQVWARARPANDFAAVRPLLEKTLDFSRQMAGFFPGCDHIADPLLDMRNEGITTAMVRELFGALRAELVALLAAIDGREAVDESCLRQRFPVAAQYAFATKAITAFGYDFERGRCDETHHPFMTKFSLGDVRITTRAQENDLNDGIFATMHEAGHALYEQGINPAYDGSPLARGASAGVHESQSRLWENRVGRSRALWEHFFPEMQRTFPEQLRDVSAEAFYRAVNAVRHSLIRVRADEVTYNLHVMLRSELSIDLLEGTVAVKDLPEVWRARYESDLGITPPDDRDGVMQDVHWYMAPIGGTFEGYTLGNILSAQVYEAALAEHPDIPEQIARGEFSTLRGWLTENIYRHGKKFTTLELTERITGGGIRVEPLVKYLRAKFGEIYDL